MAGGGYFAGFQWFSMMNSGLIGWCVFCGCGSSAPIIYIYGLGCWFGERVCVASVCSKGDIHTDNNGVRGGGREKSGVGSGACREC